MTVAAVILAARPESALADADGLPAVRRIAEAAWSGGAIPIVVVSADPAGAVKAALTGTEASRFDPAAEAGGPVGQICRGIDEAIGLVGETDGALIWPARMSWPDPETITSMIEAHGTDPEPILRPEFDGEPGWPVLMPIARLERLRSLPADLGPEQLIEALSADRLTVRTLDLGDPGTTSSVAVARADLPPYRGPAEPASGQTHEWGEVGLDEDATEQGRADRE